MSDAAPPRPESLPESARWDPEHEGFEWVEGEVDAEGERHGEYRSWTREGVLHGKCTYEHGKVVGRNENYHPDGSVSSSGEWRDGVLYDCNYYRPQGESPEPWPADAGEAVMRVCYVSADGKSNRTIRYYDGDDNEVGMDGEALPPRPEGVPDSARWFSNRGQWVDGAIRREDSEQVGPWRWWSGEGEIQREEDRDAEGRTEAIRDYEDGRLDKKTLFNAAGVKVHHWSYFDDDQLFCERRKNDDNETVFEAYWSRDGELKSQDETEWEDGEIRKRRQLGAGGKLKLEVEREADNPDHLAVTYFFEEGKPSAKGRMRIDTSGKRRAYRIEGPWEYFDEDGKLAHSFDLTDLELAAPPKHDRLPYRLNEALFLKIEPELAEVPMLAEAEKVDWENVESCYGNTGSFNSYLRALVHPESRVRYYASGRIYGECLHQGSVYESTARVMPFLVDLLGHPDADVEDLLDTVHDLAFGAYQWLGETREAIDLAEEGEDLSWTVSILGTVEAVGQNWHKLWKLMDGDDEDQRLKVLSMSAIPPASESIKQTVVEFAKNRDESPRMRACAVEALSNMEGVGPDDLLPYADDPSPLVQATAAIEMGLTFGPDSPDETIDALATALDRRAGIADDYHELPFVHEHLLARLGMAVGSIGSKGNERARKLAVPLCERIDDVDGASAPTLGRGLLALVLGRGELPFGGDFLHVLKTLVDSKKFNAFNVNAAEVLESWNLPRYPDELRPFIAQIESAEDPQAALHEHMHAE